MKIWKQEAFIFFGKELPVRKHRGDDAEILIFCIKPLELEYQKD